MKPPFPGMDPWLEHPSLWMDVHNRLIAALGDELSEALSEEYFVGIEERPYVAEGDDDELVGRGDVSISARRQRRGNDASGESPIDAGAVVVTVPMRDRIRETFLEIRKPKERRLVTVVEILSPTNKRPGEGRDAYLKKRQSVFESATSLVEIDLVRAGQRMPMRRLPGTSDYSILISRECRRPRAELLPFGVRDPIPAFHLPLDPGEEEPIVRVGDTLRAICSRTRYHRVIDYRRAPTPPLGAADQAWANRRLREAGIR